MLYSYDVIINEEIKFTYSIIYFIPYQLNFIN